MKWHAEREHNIRKENCWLALAGLFWLKEGENRIGSAPGNDILLPERLPASLGSIHLQGRQAVLQTAGDSNLQVNGSEMTQTLLKSDLEESSSFITLDGIRMVVLDRPSGMGVRLWDNLREERRLHPPRQWFDINEELRLPAHYVRHAEPRKVFLPDVFGEMEESRMDGSVSFEIDGRPLTLEASEGQDGRLEIHFQDLTNKKNTYPSGRYYYSPEPVMPGDFVLDFNYAYSPPCAFTPFATCAFAPAENHLPVPIEAGEIYGSHP
jgi:uncharacterized protein (DUF1684 family)